MEKEVIDWDECFMRICHVIAKRSKDPNTQNGSAVVNSKRVVVGLGYNGFPRSVNDSVLPWEREGGFCDTKYAYVVHAEENAIYNSNAQTEGCVLYCTLFPCNECAKTIIQCGIKEIVFESDKYHDQDVWVAARKLFDLAGIKYRQYVCDMSDDKTTEKDEQKVKLKKISPIAVVPSYAYDGDAGLDLYATEDSKLKPGERTKIKTGIAMEIPEGRVGLIWDKSGVSMNKGLKTLGGVIDANFRGEIIVGMVNVSNENVVIARGDKIAQILIQSVEKIDFDVTEELSETERGEKLLGSSNNMKSLAEEIEELKESPKYKSENVTELIQEAPEIGVEEEENENASRW